MQHLTYAQVESLAFTGVNLTLDCSSFTVSQLKNLAMIARHKESNLTLRQTQYLSAQNLLSIAFDGGKYIYFE